MRDTKSYDKSWLGTFEDFPYASPFWVNKRECIKASTSIHNINHSIFLASKSMRFGRRSSRHTISCPSRAETRNQNGPRTFLRRRPHHLTITSCTSLDLSKMIHGFAISSKLRFLSSVGWEIVRWSLTVSSLLNNILSNFEHFKIIRSLLSKNGIFMFRSSHTSLLTHCLHIFCPYRGILVQLRMEHLYSQRQFIQ